MLFLTTGMNAPWFATVCHPPQNQQMDYAQGLVVVLGGGVPFLVNETPLYGPFIKSPLALLHSPQNQRGKTKTRSTPDSEMQKQCGYLPLKHSCKHNAVHPRSELPPTRAGKQKNRGQPPTNQCCKAFHGPTHCFRTPPSPRQISEAKTQKQPKVDYPRGRTSKVDSPHIVHKLRIDFRESAGMRGAH